MIFGGDIDPKGIVPWRMASLINGTISGGVEQFATNFNYSQSFTTVTQTYFPL
jgi:hypothetical protein